MAWATIAAPGTKYGPCDQPCKHTDCAEMIKMARQTCRLCGKVIGYEVAYYKDPDVDGGLVHQNCAWAEEDRRQAAMLRGEG